MKNHIYAGAGVIIVEISSFLSSITVHQLICTWNIVQETVPVNHIMPWRWNVHATDMQCNYIHEFMLYVVRAWNSTTLFYVEGCHFLHPLNQIRYFCTNYNIMDAVLNHGRSPMRCGSMVDHCSILQFSFLVLSYLHGLLVPHNTRVKPHTM